MIFVPFGWEFEVFYKNPADWNFGWASGSKFPDY